MTLESPLLTIQTPQRIPNPSLRRRTQATKHALPAAWYRAGTSKGLFIQQQHLPKDRSAWRNIILSAMGSQDGDAKQLNGIGGGSPTTSKVAVVAKSAREGIDLEYTFIQVVPNSGKIDITGNCGNIASGVAPFALDEGMIVVPTGQDEARLRILNTNTNKVMESTVRLDTDGRTYEKGDYLMPGLSSEGSPIEVSFLHPAGSMTGKMLPTGYLEDWLEDEAETFSVRCTLFDAANPFVLVHKATLPEQYHHLGQQNPASLRIIENIRRLAAVKMGLAKTVEAAALTRGTPKIAVLSPSHSGADIHVTSFSTGCVHPSVQLTGAVCIASAVSTPGTIAWDISMSSRDSSREVSPSPSSSVTSHDDSCIWPSTSILERSQQCRKVRIEHASGQIEADVESSISSKAGSINVDSVTIIRTARRLFEGKVFYDSVSR